MKTFRPLPRLLLAAVILVPAAVSAQNHRVLAHFPSLDGPANVVQADPVRGVVYIGGNFSVVGGQPRTFIAALSLATGAVLPWNPVLDNTVSDILVTDGAVFLAGAFVQVNGTMRRGIAAIDPVSGALLPWNANSNHRVRRVVRAGARLFVTGDFSQIGGQSRQGLASLALAGGGADGWDPAPTGKVWTLHVDGEAVYAGGDFTAIGGKARQFAAMLNQTNGAATNWDPAPDAVVWVIRTYRDRVILGGEFTLLGTQARRALGAVDKIQGQALSWNPLVSSPAPALPYVVAMHPVGTHLIFGGGFQSVGGAARSNVADVHLETGAPRNWFPQPNSNLYRIAGQGSTVFLGGDFNQVGGVSRKGFAAVEHKLLLPSVKIAGPASRRSSQARLGVRGTASCSSGPLAFVRLSVGSAAPRPVLGTAAWRTRVKLKRGINRIEARSHAKSGLVSPPSRIRVRRR